MTDTALNPPALTPAPAEAIQRRSTGLWEVLVRPDTPEAGAERVVWRGDDPTTAETIAKFLLAHWPARQAALALARPKPIAQFDVAGDVWTVLVWPDQDQSGKPEVVWRGQDETEADTIALFLTEHDQARRAAFDTV